MYDDDFLSSMITYIEKRAAYWHRYHGQRYPKDDYVDIGIENLALCLQRHDPEKGSIKGYINVSINAIMRGLPGRQRKYDAVSLEGVNSDGKYFERSITDFSAVSNIDSSTDIIPLLQTLCVGQRRLIKNYLLGASVESLMKDLRWSRETVISEINLILIKLRQSHLKKRRRTKRF